MKPSEPRGERPLIIAPHARAQLGELCRGYADSAVVLVTDPRLASSTPYPGEVAETLDGAGLRVDLLTLPPAQLGLVESARTVHEQMRATGARLCIALGGGSVIDAAKLARAAHHEPWLLDRVVWRRSAGLLGLQRAHPVDEPPFLVAASTRPGSAAELTARVALAPDEQSSRRLLTGEGLQPTAAAVDPCWSRTLSPAEWLHSITEILFRLVGPFLTTRRSSRRLDRAAVAWLEELLDIGMEIAERESPDPGQRLRVAELSAATVLGAHVRQWTPAMPAWWCIQNTVSTRTGRPKGALTAQALPTLLERIAGGDKALGSASRLRRMEAHAGRGRRLTSEISQFCAMVQQADTGAHARVSDEQLAEYAREVHLLWSQHPGIAALAVGGTYTILRAAGF